MRLIIKLKPNFELRFKEFNTYWIQGLIYKLIVGSEFDRHNENKFKWFNYYILPKTNFKISKEKYLIISSPNKDFICFLNERFEEMEKLVFGNKFESNITETKNIKPKTSYNWWKVETPIILDIGKKANKKHLYWTPHLKEENLKGLMYF